MTGARRSEVLALRWTAVDLERGVVTIGRGLVQGPDGLVEKDTKTHQIRRVVLDAPTTAVLTDHRSAAVERAQHGSMASRVVLASRVQSDVVGSARPRVENADGRSASK